MCIYGMYILMCVYMYIFNAYIYTYKIIFPSCYFIFCAYFFANFTVQNGPVLWRTCDNKTLWLDFDEYTGHSLTNWSPQSALRPSVCLPACLSVCLLTAVVPVRSQGPRRLQRRPQTRRTPWWSSWPSLSRSSSCCRTSSRARTSLCSPRRWRRTRWDRELCLSVIVLYIYTTGLWDASPSL